LNLIFFVFGGWVKNFKSYVAGLFISLNVTSPNPGSISNRTSTTPLPVALPTMSSAQMCPPIDDSANEGWQLRHGGDGVRVDDFTYLKQLHPLPKAKRRSLC
jgi:hypothetical protein